MSDRSYTKDQEIIVEKILKHKSHEYYKILEIDQKSTDTEIKKAYRKISLKVHPDKNSHPKAADCFKIVNKAFEVLGDSNKRRIYDQTGSDPDQRGGMGSTSGFSAFNRGAGGAGSSPFGGPFGNFQTSGPGDVPFGFDNDLFDILFGNTHGTTFSFGGPGQGFTFTSAGGGSPFGGAGGSPFGNARTGGIPRTRRQQQQHQRQQQPTPPEDLFQTIKQLLPLFAVLIIPIISNLFAETSPNIPFQLEKSGQFTQQRISHRFKIPYFIKPKSSTVLTEKVARKLDKEAESYYTGFLKNKCNREQNYKDEKINDAYGWFFHDEEKLREANSIRLPSCEKLMNLGLL